MLRYIALFVLLALVLGCSRFKDKEVVRINGQSVFLKEFRKSCELFPHFDRSADSETALRQQLDYLIDLTLAADEAKRRELHHLPQFTLQRKMLEKEEARDDLYREIIQKPIQIKDEEVLEAYRLKQYQLKVKMLWSDSKKTISAMRQKLLSGQSVESVADVFYGKGNWSKQDILLPEITWGDLDEDLENIIFALKIGEVSKPVMRSGVWVIFKLEDYKQNIFVTEADFIKNRPVLEKKILKRKAAKAARAFVAEYMGRQQIHIRAPAFNFLWKYARKQAGLAQFRKDSLKIESIPTELVGELENHLQDTLLVSRKNVWTIENFLERLKTTPPAQRPHMLHPRRFRYELQQFILNEFLSDLAYSREMQKTDAVRQAIAEWEKSFLSDFLQQEMIKQIRISPAEIKDKYRQFPERYQVPEKRKIQEIFSQSKDKIQKVWKKLRGGAKFDLLVEKYSERRVGDKGLGILGFLSLSELGEIGPTVFQMKKGEISTPVKTQNGYVIIKLLGIQQKHKAKFEEVAGQIERELRNERHLQNWRLMLTNLRANAKIRINTPLLKAEAKNFDPGKSITLFGLRKAFRK